jgi:hypothetical protein
LHPLFAIQSDPYVSLHYHRHIIGSITDAKGNCPEAAFHELDGFLFLFRGSSANDDGVTDDCEVNEDVFHLSSHLNQVWPLRKFRVLQSLVRVVVVVEDEVN